jgi:hypothetical protein
MSRYLSLARNALAAYEKNEKNEESPDLRLVNSVSARTTDDELDRPVGETASPIMPLDPAIITELAARLAPDEIAQHIAGIEARLAGSGELPGDRQSLRYWEAIATERAREDLKQDIIAAVDIDPKNFDRAGYERLVEAGHRLGLYES